MKKIISIIAITILSNIGYSQNGPKIEFKTKENTIDFGTISKGKDSGIRTIEFTNTGNAPLIIVSIQSTSSFTVLSKINSPILPGKSDKIEVKYNMTLGPIRKTITVETNAINYEEGRIPFKIKGEVIAN